MAAAAARTARKVLLTLMAAGNARWRRAGMARQAGAHAYVPSVRAVWLALRSPERMRRARAEYRVGEILLGAAVATRISVSYVRSMGLAQGEYAPLAALQAAAGSSGEIGEASARLAAATSLDPCFAEAHYLLGHAYMEQSMWAQAAGSFQAAARHSPRFKADALDAPLRTRSLVNAGIALEAAGDLPGAASAYRAASSTFPAYPEAHLRYGRVALKQGDAASAGEHLLMSFRPIHYVPTSPRLPALGEVQAEIRAAREAASAKPG
jgi:tetratricopeptide (TPR) repeat protein